MDATLELILGGARSGKSKLAENRAMESGSSRVYIATATGGDREMSERILHHQSRRDDSWRLVEEPLGLAQALAENQAEQRCVLVDCLTLWLSNCLHAKCWERERDALFAVLSAPRGRTIFVSNETGLGVVPMGELSRQFVDEAGFLHQALSQVCSRVTLTVAGLPVELKPPRDTMQ